jgi:hypothetical protein
MRDFESIYSGNITGGFPRIKARNDTGADTTDGTPYEEKIINDCMLGWTQALLARAGMIPNGKPEGAQGDAPDAPLESQIVDALLRLSIGDATFVVDTRQAFADWCNNVRSAGQNYMSVYIRKSVPYSFSGTLNLTATGTRRIYCESMGGIQIDGGVRYNAVPADSDYRIFGMYVFAIASTASAFTNCRNLVCCSGSGLTGYGFYNCRELVSCLGTQSGCTTKTTGALVLDPGAVSTAPTPPAGAKDTRIATAEFVANAAVRSYLVVGDERRYLSDFEDDAVTAFNKLCAMTDENTDVPFKNGSVRKILISELVCRDDLAGISYIAPYFMYNFIYLVNIDLSGIRNLAGIGKYFLFNCKIINGINLSPLFRISEIPEGFLMQCRELKSLDLSPLSGVHQIGADFLSACVSLSYLDFSPLMGVNYIGPNFLFGCTTLGYINISALIAVNMITGAFIGNCAHLERIKFPDSDSFLSGFGTSPGFLVSSRTLCKLFVPNRLLSAWTAWLNSNGYSARVPYLTEY